MTPLYYFVEFVLWFGVLALALGSGSVWTSKIRQFRTGKPAPSKVLLALIGIICAFSISFYPPFAQAAFGGKPFLITLETKNRTMCFIEHIPISDFPPDVDRSNPKIKLINISSSLYNRFLEYHRFMRHDNGFASTFPQWEIKVSHAYECHTDPNFRVFRHRFTEVANFYAPYSWRTSAKAFLAYAYPLNPHVSPQFLPSGVSAQPPLNNSYSDQSASYNNKKESKGCEKGIGNFYSMAPYRPEFGINLIVSFFAIVTSIVVQVIGWILLMNNRRGSGVALLIVGLFFAFSSTVGLLFGVDLWSLWLKARL